MLMRLSTVLLAAVLSSPVPAQQFTLGALSIERPWARELPPVAPNGAAYFAVRNGEEEPDRLVSLHSPMADRAEIHTHEMDGGMMKMRHLHFVEVPAQGVLTFEPGGLHVMLLGLENPLVAGESFPLTLEFERTGTIKVMVEVTPR